MNRQNANFLRENQLENENSDSMFITCTIAQEGSKEVWFLDNGCSNHMSGNKDMFASIDESVESEVKLGDNTKAIAMGKGSINIKTKQGEKKHIPDVYYVPNLKHNLISIGQLGQKGYRVYFEDSECVILDKNVRLIANVQMTQNRMFPLDCKMIRL
eukprot:Gb_25819 [translate_table: standard]